MVSSLLLDLVFLILLAFSNNYVQLFVSLFIKPMTTLMANSQWSHVFINGLVCKDRFLALIHLLTSYVV